MLCSFYKKSLSSLIRIHCILFWIHCLRDQRVFTHHNTAAEKSRHSSPIQPQKITATNKKRDSSNRQTLWIWPWPPATPRGFSITAALFAWKIGCSERAVFETAQGRLWGQQPPDAPAPPFFVLRHFVLSSIWARTCWAPLEERLGLASTTATDKLLGWRSPLWVWTRMYKWPWMDACIIICVYDNGVMLNSKMLEQNKEMQE